MYLPRAHVSPRVRNDVTVCRVEVPMMRAQLQLQLGYSVELEARTLELPLTERRMSLFLILPDYLDPGIHQLEANFTKQHVRALMSTLQVERHVKMFVLLFFTHSTKLYRMNYTEHFCYFIIRYG